MHPCAMCLVRLLQSQLQWAWALTYDRSGAGNPEAHWLKSPRTNRPEVFKVEDVRPMGAPSHLGIWPYLWGPILLVETFNGQKQVVRCILMEPFAVILIHPYVH